MRTDGKAFENGDDVLSFEMMRDAIDYVQLVLLHPTLFHLGNCGHKPPLTACHTWTLSSSKFFANDYFVGWSVVGLVLFIKVIHGIMGVK